MDYLHRLNNQKSDGPFHCLVIQDAGMTILQEWQGEMHKSSFTTKALGRSGVSLKMHVVKNMVKEEQIFNVVEINIFEGTTISTLFLVVIC